MMENPFNERSFVRPTLLLILCILTFIGSGWEILHSLFSLFTHSFMNIETRVDQSASLIETLETQGIYSGLPVVWMDFMTNLVQSSVQLIQVMAVHAKEIYVFELILSVISLVGAIFMFQLRRTGFYLYTTAQLLSLFILPYFAGFLLPVVLFMFFSSFFFLIFIILYAMNLKYMVR